MSLTIRSCCLAALLLTLTAHTHAGETLATAEKIAKPGIQTAPQATAQPPTVTDSGTQTKSTPAAQKVPQEPIGNRRWLIKRRDGAAATPPRKTTPIKWASTQQKSTCESVSGALRDSFEQARYYSIQGDSCNTAAHAGRFLDLYRSGSAACPEGFLAQRGFRDPIPRNMVRLVDLGAERCQDGSRVAGSASGKGGAQAVKGIKP